LPDFVSLKVSDLQVETAASIIILSDQWPFPTSERKLTPVRYGIRWMDGCRLCTSLQTRWNVPLLKRQVHPPSLGGPSTGALAGGENWPLSDFLQMRYAAVLNTSAKKSNRRRHTCLPVAETRKWRSRRLTNEQPHWWQDELFSGRQTEVGCSFDQMVIQRQAAQTTLGYGAGKLATAWVSTSSNNNAIIHVYEFK
jgi:hypothetical protein